MFSVRLTDSNGFLFCTLTVRDIRKLEKTLLRYATIEGLGVDVWADGEPFPSDQWLSYLTTEDTPWP